MAPSHAPGERLIVTGFALACQACRAGILPLPPLQSLHRPPEWFGGIAWLLTLASFAAGQTLKDPALQVREVVAGLSLPTTMAFIGPRDLLVLQKNDGRVRRVLDYWLWPKGKDKG